MRTRRQICRASDLESFNARWIGEPNSGCWLWIGGNRDDHRAKPRYGVFRLSGASFNIGAHRASYILHRGHIDVGLWVLHKCDTPACVNPDHLFLGTVTDNNRDTVKKGRHRNGIRPPRTIVREAA